MNMDWIWLILCAFFSAYSFYAWKKYSDGQFFWLGILGFVIVFILIFKLLLLNTTLNQA